MTSKKCPRKKFIMTMLRSIEETCKTTLPKRRRRTAAWVSEESDQLIEARKAARKRYTNHRNERNYNCWRDAASAADQSLSRDKRVHYESIGTEAVHAAQRNNTREVYKLIRTLSEQQPSVPAFSVLKMNGEAPESKTGLLNEWAAYFATLLNNASTIHHVNIPAAETDL